MDDFVIFDNDKDRLWSLKKQITDYVEKLNLRLHENKCCVYKTSAGIPFLGMIIFPDRRRLKRQNVIRFKRRLKRFQQEYENGDVSWAHINQSIQSWIGHAAHADTARLRENILSNTVFRKG
jgi:RNA-directed DNA polymerase